MKYAFLLMISLATLGVNAGENIESSPGNFVLKYPGPLDFVFGDLNDDRISLATAEGSQELAKLADASPLLQNNLKLYDRLTDALNTRSVKSALESKLFQHLVGSDFDFKSLFVQVYVKQSKRRVSVDNCAQVSTMISLLVINQKDEVSSAASIFASNCDTDKNSPTVQQLLQMPADQILSSAVDLLKPSRASMPARNFRE